MIGLVLSGGLSSRMGQDKGLILDSQGQFWAQKAQQLIRKANITCYISINSKQNKAYSSIFSPLELIIDSANLPVEGPLKGLLSANILFPNEDIFVIATDMHHLQLKQIDRLISFHASNSEQTIWAYQNHGYSEPLCAIYSARVLAKVMHTPPKSFSLTALIKQNQTAFLNIPEHEIRCFENFNYPPTRNLT